MISIKRIHKKPFTVSFIYVRCTTAGRWGSAKIMLGSVFRGRAAKMWPPIKSLTQRDGRESINPK